MRINTVALILFWVTSFNIPYWSVAVAQSNLSIESSKHSCYYKYDKAGHLLSVEYALNSDKNEYYSYDVSGNITEKRIGNSIGSDIYVNEPHVSGGVPIISKTSEGVRYHEHDFLGTTLWSSDLNGNLAKTYSDTTIFGVGSIQKDVSARFTGKPYDSDLQAYVFPYRNYDASLARWRSSDPAGYPDGINQHFYAAVPTYELDLLGFWKLSVIVVAYSPASDQVIPDGQSTASVNVEVPLVRFLIQREKGDGTGEKTFHVTGKVNFNNGTWKEVSHDFTVLEGIVSTQFDTPNLGSKSYELAAGKYTGSVTLSAPGLKSDSGNFTINVVEK